MLVLVRHADAGDKHRWTGPDHLRPLSRKGSRQAADAVATLLTDLGVSRLLSSPALRCVQTLTPTAERLGLDVATSDDLGVGGSVERLLQLLEQAESEGAALCTHGETLIALSDAWRRSGRVAMEQAGSRRGLEGTPKGASWLVEGYRSPLARASYLAPGRRPHR